MSDLVPASEIEEIVGAARHPVHHLARAVSAEQVVYVLHSERCKASGIDLRDCSYSQALDNGIDREAWTDLEDCAVIVTVDLNRLIPERAVGPA